MDYPSTSEYTFLLSIKGKENRRIFDTEIHKKKLLDAARECTGRIRIFGYCVLDFEGYFFAGCTEKADAEGLAEKIMEKYKILLEQKGFGKLHPWEMTIRECQRDELWEELISLHYLPVIHDYTIWPEHYWWSSYPEYLGRNWMHFQICKSGNDIKKMHKEWKKQHPEIFKKMHI